MCHILTLPCFFICEMFIFHPMLMKFYMLKLDILLDILVLSLHFYQLPLLIYDFSKGGVTICVTPCDVQLD